MKLYKYQQELSDQGLQILKKYRMLYLALEPRTGKSLISLDALHTQDPDQFILFVTTKSAIDGVTKVIAEMGYSQLIVVTNYQQLHNFNGEFDTIILDEAHKNISMFPRPGKAYKELQRLIKDDTQIIWMSGTPQIESSSKLFHQLSLSPFHTFHYYKNFYAWFFPQGHYKDDRQCGAYGVPYSKFVGRREVPMYDKTINFDQRFSPMMIKGVLSDYVDIHSADIRPVRLEMLPRQSELYHSMQTSSVIEEMDCVADSGAGRLSKLQQITGGAVIGDNETFSFANVKLEYIMDLEQEMPIFYKYQAEYEMLKDIVDESLLFQIDSQNTGLDLSQYDEMMIYSLTFSGSNYLQVISRVINTERTTLPTVYILLCEDTVDEEIFEAVSNKRDMNTHFLRS